MVRMTLTTADHDRDAAGLKYVYPVVSRRAGGVSLGVNLNVNNACNWRCVYCQVPELVRGGPPPVDMARLEAELRRMLDAIVLGDFMVREVPEEMRRLNDIALSGNGEPTSAEDFPEVVGLVGALIREYGLAGRVKPILISNGSLVRRARIHGSEVWFKLDRVGEAPTRRVNGVASHPDRVLRALATTVAHCPTWIQTCVFALDGAPPAEPELTEYLNFLARALNEGITPRGVLLYGLARASTQPEAPRLARLPRGWVEALAARIERVGLPCRAFP
jgi:wyosine [tRNA(Phe)-imidazoG37] synthetase (radical SAM superfamily)